MKNYKVAVKDKNTQIVLWEEEWYLEKNEKEVLERIKAVTSWKLYR